MHVVSRRCAIVPAARLLRADYSSWTLDPSASPSLVGHSNLELSPRALASAHISFTSSHTSLQDISAYTHEHFLGRGFCLFEWVIGMTNANRREAVSLYAVVHLPRVFTRPMSAFCNASSWGECRDKSPSQGKQGKRRTWRPVELPSAIRVSVSPSLYCRPADYFLLEKRSKVKSWA